MKELTIEEKAKRYDEALERYKAKQEYESKEVHKFIEYIFPELKKDEDEMARKYLISFVELNSGFNLPPEDAKKILAWLEKQGEQKSIDDLTPQEAMDVAVAKCFEQGEQKPADKVESKFKDGDWVVYNNDICQIVKREEGCNKLVTVFGIEKELVNERNLSTARLWNIKDAKDGDVLFTSSTASHETFIFKSIDERGNAECYFAYDSEDGFREGKYHFIGSAINCKPATKEQRDTLERCMTNAGYIFDFGKKELKKIEKNPVWSEEDEEMLSSIVARLHSHPNVDLEEYSKEYNWLNYTLKSLKERYTWKPSEEQIKMLENVRKILHTNKDIYSKANNLMYNFEELIRTLKKLKS